MVTSASDATLCAFVALEVPRPTQTAIAREIERLELIVPGILWADPYRAHILMRFLGWTTRDRLEALIPHLRTAAAACGPLDATVGGLKTFPPEGPGQARVLWVGVDVPREGRTLQTACDRAAEALGFPPERRKFSPHVTLGRWKNPVRKPVLPPVEIGPARLERLALFRTNLLKAGAPAGARRELAAASKLEVFPLG